MSGAVGFEHQYTVNSGGVPIAVHATEAPWRGRPVAVLVHGAAYLAQVWNAVLPALAASHTVLAIDRRGHGLSGRSEAGYDFADFADDLVAVLDRLDVRDAYGIGHSAGATDMLLAAARRPQAFSRLFVVEPTAMVPGDDAAPEPPLAELLRWALDKIRSRRSTFESREAALEWMSKAAAFAGWREPLVSTFVDHGLIRDRDGFTLRCRPAVEAAMVEPIFRVMGQTYRSSAQFAALSQLSMPVRIAACEHSGPLYPPMVTAAKALISHASDHFFTTGHCVAQQDPEGFAAAVLAYARG
jgi:pimeloyl-ACP methyl ester carboxylesterase